MRVKLVRRHTRLVYTEDFLKVLLGALSLSLTAFLMPPHCTLKQPRRTSHMLLVGRRHNVSRGITICYTCCRE